MNTHTQTQERTALKILVLDDDPARHEVFAKQAEGHTIKHVWFVDAAIRAIKSERWDMVCLDNDLETEQFEREGYEVADFIASLPSNLRPETVLVHSWNTVRSRQMMATLMPIYRPDRLARWEFGEFSVVAPGSHCAETSLKAWLKEIPTSDRRHHWQSLNRAYPIEPTRRRTGRTRRSSVGLDRVYPIAEIGGRDED